MDTFLKDFVSGKLLGRYVPGVLPTLPFASNHFDTTLCANLLFIYSDIESGGMLHNSPMDYDFHMKALRELLRITRSDVRIYPLQGPNVTEHKFLTSKEILLVPSRCCKLRNLAPGVQIEVGDGY
jgi:SAM-dependent methyltransferase